jgi:hypothetical protein
MEVFFILYYVYLYIYYILHETALKLNEQYIHKKKK